MEQGAIFVFDTASAFVDRVRAPLLSAGFEVIGAASVAELSDGLRARRGQVVILGPSLPARADESLVLAQFIHDTFGLVPVILVVANSSENFAIAALRAGVNEYVRLERADAELPDAVRRCLRLAEGDRAQYETIATPQDGIIGESPAMREIRARIDRLAPSDSNVLITGETGTGKELFAALVHKKSRRRDKPFVPINCAAIPDTLLESELFGHAKGAFTGADSVQDGRLKAADQGTLFLDEIGDMSAYSQAKILRVIENKEIQRLGCSRGIPVNIRVVAATNQDLDQLSRENKFRRDLFFRLNVTRIHLPPLRERKEDLPSLIEHYVDEFSRQFHSKVHRVTDEALDCMFCYDWPGNIRELRNLLESIFAEDPQTDISLQDLPSNFRMRCAELKSLPEDERGRLLWALAATNWNKSKAAEKLRWSRMTLYRKMERYNIFRENSTGRTTRTLRSRS
jgi:DNA-binding NtrC family response regulator